MTHNATVCCEFDGSTFTAQNVVKISRFWIFQFCFQFFSHVLFCNKRTVKLEVKYFIECETTTNSAQNNASTIV